MGRFIVAEISKNWTDDSTENEELISNKFEKVINVNYERGYKLIEWKLDRVSVGTSFNETIIAIFETTNSGIRWK